MGTEEQVLVSCSAYSHPSLPAPWVMLPSDSHLLPLFAQVSMIVDFLLPKEGTAL